MKQILLTFALISSLFLATSCDKDDDPKPDVQPTEVEPVDLGLSVLWSPMNIGASEPEDFGSYFAWAEVATKSEYVWSTYRHGSGPEKMTKYTGRDGNLQITDDAAAAIWGGTWRLPTSIEFNELVQKCKWEWETHRLGVSGYKVTGPNGNSIFLPAGGRRDEYGQDKEGEGGYYWSGSLYFTQVSYAWRLHFTKEKVYSNYAFFRYQGHNLRPVCAK